LRCEAACIALLLSFTIDPSSVHPPPTTHASHSRTYTSQLATCRVSPGYLASWHPGTTSIGTGRQAPPRCHSSTCTLCKPRIHRNHYLPTLVLLLLLLLPPVVDAVDAASYACASTCKGPCCPSYPTPASHTLRQQTPQACHLVLLRCHRYTIALRECHCTVQVQRSHYCRVSLHTTTNPYTCSGLTSCVTCLGCIVA
jgi:hypothetical protein